MKILIAHYKHGDEYFLWDSEETQKASALKVFELNDNQEFYYDLDDDEEAKDLEKKIAKLAKEIGVAEMAGGISENYINKLKLDKARAEVRLKEITHQMDLYKQAKAGDPKAAYKLLKLRQDHEYEGFSFGEVQ